MDLPEQGDILKNTKTGKRFVIAAIHLPDVTLCALDTTKFELISYPYELVRSMVEAGDFIKQAPEHRFFDIDALDEEKRAKYDRQLAIMREVEAQYGPNFMGLVNQRSKPALNGIIEKYSMPRKTFWALLRKYFQSGRMEYSLLDQRTFHAKRDKPYKYKEKPGRPAKYGKQTRLYRDEELTAIFEEMTKEYINSKTISYKKLYDLMLNRYFMREEVVNGKVKVAYAPPEERPSFYQLKYFVQTHTTPKQRHTAKTSVREFRNNERPVSGDEVSDAKGPGDLVLIDAQEADASLISIYDKDQCVGRATVYIMLDTYSKLIIAVAIGFQMNSNQGFTDLFMCLGDDKHEFCRRYGIDFEDDDLFPEGFIPARIRVDRGAEMQSKMVEELLVRAGIGRQSVPPAMGSAKGSIEQIFHQMGAAINVHLEKKGLITKDYNSKHHEQAVLSVEAYAQAVLTFCLTHNREYMEGYPLTLEQQQAGINPVPVELWKYGIEKYGAPQPIPNKRQYLFNLMKPVTASLSFRWICYEGLYYRPYDDPELANEVTELGRKSKPMKVKIDTRCVGAVYYMRGDEIITAPLNPALVKQKGVERLTLKQWKNVRDDKTALDKLGREYNEENHAYEFAALESIVDAAEKTTVNNTKDMRAARAVEKERTAASSTLVERMDPGLLGDIADAADAADAIGAGEVPAETPADTTAEADASPEEKRKKSKYERLKAITEEVFTEKPKEQEN